MIEIILTVFCQFLDCFSHFGDLRTKENHGPFRNITEFKFFVSGNHMYRMKLSNSGNLFQVTHQIGSLYYEIDVCSLCFVYLVYSRSIV